MWYANVLVTSNAQGWRKPNAKIGTHGCVDLVVRGLRSLKDQRVPENWHIVRQINKCFERCLKFSDCSLNAIRQKVDSISYTSACYKLKVTVTIAITTSQFVFLDDFLSKNAFLLVKLVGIEKSCHNREVRRSTFKFPLTSQQKVLVFC